LASMAAAGINTTSIGTTSRRVWPCVEPTSQHVVHAGGAIVYGASNQAASGDAAPTGWAQTDTWVSSLDGVTPLNTIDNPYPSGFPAINPVQSGILTGAGGAISGVIQHSPTPYSIQWGLDIQQQIPFGITTDIAYVVIADVNSLQVSSLAKMRINFRLLTSV